MNGVLSHLRGASFHRVFLSAVMSGVCNTRGERYRTDAWKKFVKARKYYGRNSDLTALAWRDYSSINIEYRNFSISRQCEMETNLTCNQSNKPNVFLKHIRRKKKGKPLVGPLKIENREISDPQEMSEVFVRSFR